MEKRELPIPDSPALSAERPWHEKSRGEKLAKNADLSLDFNNQLLNLGAGVADQLGKGGVEIDPRQMKLLEMAKDVALMTISQRLRVEQWMPPEPASEKPHITVIPRFVKAQTSNDEEPPVVGADPEPRDHPVPSPPPNPSSARSVRLSPEEIEALEAQLACLITELDALQRAVDDDDDDSDDGF